MSKLTISDLHMAFGARDVLRGVSIDLPAGARVGMVGANGSGKSTLMRIIVGEETPTGGTVNRARGDRLTYVAQEPLLVPGRSVFEEALSARADLLELEQQLAVAADALAGATNTDAEAAQMHFAQLETRFERSGGYTFEADAKRVLHALGLAEPFWARPAGSLSGGERSRLGLARALLQQPDVLLLDEPTNHLDLETLTWLENILLDRRGTLMVVSHDRYFLDRVATTIWELHDGIVEVFPGNYSAYEHHRQERDTRQMLEYERQRAEIARQETFIRRYKAGQRARQAQGRQTRLDRLERIEAIEHRPHLSITTGKPVRSGDVAIRLSRLVVAHPARTDEPIVTGPEQLDLYRGQRAAIIGRNGAGKTTLLRTIMGELEPLQGEARLGGSVTPAFYRQAAEELNPDDTVLDAIIETSGLLIPQARDLAARFLFRGEDVFSRVGDLSGGERSRLSLARLFSSGANVLLLDEPTNHLDLPAREALEAALQSYGGSLLFVSHDRRFIDTVATHLWLVVDGRLVLFEGNWTAYQASLRAAEPTASVAPAIGPPAGRAGRPPTKTERRHEATVRELERQVAEAEAELARLHELLEAASEAANVGALTSLSSRYAHAEDTLAHLMDAWEDAARAVS